MNLIFITCVAHDRNLKQNSNIYCQYFSWSDSVRIYVNVACDISWREKMLKNEKNVAAGNWYGLRGVITGFIEVHNSGSNMITWPGQYPASNKMFVSDEKEDLIFDINPRPPSRIQQKFASNSSNPFKLYLVLKTSFFDNFIRSQIEVERTLAEYQETYFLTSCFNNFIGSQIVWLLIILIRHFKHWLGAANNIWEICECRCRHGRCLASAL